MKIGIISTTSPRGQIVIPASIRQELGITHTVPLQFLVRGKTLCITPIRDVITMQDSNDNYLEILRKTKGSWSKEQSVAATKKKTELDASAARKQAW